MPARFIIPPDEIDTSRVIGDIEEIKKRIPHRYEMLLLDGILRYDPDKKLAIGYKDQTEDEFWVRGHIPGRPLMPGVLMVETAAQLCTYYYKRTVEDERFMGFGGINNAKFRRAVKPGDKLVLAVQNTELRSRRMRFDAQGIVDGRLAFECEVVGFAM